MSPHTSALFPSVSRLAAIGALGFAVGACAPPASPRTQLAFHLRQAEAAVEEGGHHAVTLRYAVHGADGDWTYDVAFGEGGAFAERRSLGGEAFAFGLEDDRAWLQVRDRPPVGVSGTWATEARSEAALLGLRFLDPTPADRVERARASRGRWGLSIVPPGGRGIDVELDLATNLPASFSYVDAYDRVAVCDRFSWKRVEGRSVVRSMVCATISGDVGRIETSYALESAERGLASWARPASILPEPRLAGPAVTPITDPTRIHVPVASGSGEAAALLLDSGSPWTVLTASAARALGVVRTGAPVKAIRPPWLPDSSLWVGVVDRLQIGAGAAAEIHGMSVLVADEDEALGGEPGLLGTDVFRRFVVDLDTPARALRLNDPTRFAPPPGAYALPIVGTAIGRVTVLGEVFGVDDGRVIIDTGASQDIIVMSWRMRALHPRRPGQGVRLGTEDSVMSEYESQIDGFRLGPFTFGPRPVLAQDRDKHGNVPAPGAVALVGMGTLQHFRLVFDMHDAVLWAVPGPTYPGYANGSPATR